MNKSLNSIDDYINSFPNEVQHTLTEMRNIIKQTAPEAIEAIKYAMPTFVLNGNLVHFAAYKNHIGFYPAPLSIITFANKLIDYNTSKGAIQFPLNKPLPLALIVEITKFRMEENLKKMSSKK